MQKTPWKLLFTLGGVHFIADAISGFTVTSTAIHYSFLNIALIILSYNVLTLRSPYPQFLQLREFIHT